MIPRTRWYGRARDIVPGATAMPRGRDTDQRVRGDLGRRAPAVRALIDPRTIKALHWWRFVE